MKRIVNVQLSKTIEIEIPDDALSADSIKEFEASFWKLDSENKVNELIGYAAVQVAIWGEHFVEGFGQAAGFHNSNPKKVISYCETYFDSEFDVELVKSNG